MVLSWNLWPFEPFVVAGLDAVGVVVDDDVDDNEDEDDAGSIAMSSKEVDRISSRRAFASLMTVLESWRMCSPKRARRPAEVEVVEEEREEDEEAERRWLL